MAECIRIEQLSHIYMPDSPFEKVSLKNLSFSVEKGEFLGIIGHTGSGKSTLIQMFNGLLKPTQGKVFVNGQEIHATKETMKKARRTVGMVFQYPEYQLFEETVWQDIAFGPKNLGLTGEEIKQNVQEAAEMVELTPELLQKSPFDLSGGQKRRAAIAGVLAMKPEILVLDEPIAGLDPKARKRILEQINRLHQSTKMTVIMISHSMEDVARYANRILVLNQGELVCDGAPKEVFLQRETIEQMGLSVPQISALIQTMSKRGIPVDPYAFTAQDAAQTILDAIRGGGVHA